VSLGLGIGSAVVGMACQASEATVDSICDPELQRCLNEYKWESSTFQALEERILRSCLNALEPCLPEYPHLQWLYDMCASSPSCAQIAGKQDVEKALKPIERASKVAASLGPEALTQAFESAAKVASGAVEVMDETSTIVLRTSQVKAAVASDAGHAAKVALNTMGNVLVVTGAVFSVGFCIWGWCSSKENVQMVDRLERSLEMSDAALKGVIDEGVARRPSFCAESQQIAGEKE